MPEDMSFLLLPGFSAIGFMSAVEPLRVANRFRGDLYRWRILSLDGEPVAASNGISINAEAAIVDVHETQTVFVVAGFEPLACYTRALGDCLKRLERAGTTLGGIDTGSFVLAEAGLLRDSDSVTVHWEALSAFRERFPSLNAVWMKLPCTRMRSQSAPKCPSTTLPSVGSPSRHMSATPPCETRYRVPAA